MKITFLFHSSQDATEAYEEFFSEPSPSYTAELDRKNGFITVRKIDEEVHLEIPNGVTAIVI